MREVSKKKNHKKHFYKLILGISHFAKNPFKLVMNDWSRVLMVLIHA